MTTARSSPFARRVAGMFTTRIAQFGIGMVISFLLSRLLGPTGRGAFALATLVPSTLFALGQFGLPSAFSYFAGRGLHGRSLWRTGLVLAVALSLVLLLGALLLLPVLETSVLESAPDDLVRIALLSLPFQFVASFFGAALIGRQTLLAYNLVLIGQSLSSLALVIVLVGALDMGPAGAVIANVAVAAIGAIAVTVTLRRTSTEDESGASLHLPDLARYGIRLYPASLSSFFGYRVDIFLLGALLVGSGDEVAAGIGLYTLAVSLAELTFFVPDSVATVFFPRVAGAERASADEMTPMVSRMTVLVTVLVTLALIPAAFGAVHVILPAFVDSLGPFLLLLPGVLALGVAKVLSSYISGVGQPLPVAAASLASLGTNVVANILLIPQFGIAGASAASLLSYSVNMVVLLAISARLSRRSPSAFLVPTRTEVDRLVVAFASVRRRVLGGRGRGNV